MGNTGPTQCIRDVEKIQLIHTNPLRAVLLQTIKFVDKTYPDRDNHLPDHDAAHRLSTIVNRFCRYVKDEVSLDPRSTDDMISQALTKCIFGVLNYIPLDGTEWVQTVVHASPRMWLRHVVLLSIHSDILPTMFPFMVPVVRQVWHEQAQRGRIEGAVHHLGGVDAFESKSLSCPADAWDTKCMVCVLNTATTRPPVSDTERPNHVITWLVDLGLFTTQQCPFVSIAKGFVNIEFVRYRQSLAIAIVTGTSGDSMDALEWVNNIPAAKWKDDNGIQQHEWVRPLDTILEYTLEPPRFM